MTPQQLTDAAESVGARVVVTSKPTHATGQRRYPHISLTYRGQTREFHHATVRRCAEEAMRWLTEVSRDD